MRARKSLAHAPRLRCAERARAARAASRAAPLVDAPARRARTPRAASAPRPSTSSASAAPSTARRDARRGRRPRSTALQRARHCARHRRRARSSGRAAREAVVAPGRASRARTLPGRTSKQREGPDRRRLVPAAGAVHDEGALDAACRRAPAAISSRGRQVEGADHVERRRGRIGQRPQDVEHRAHAERRAHRRDGLHRRVVVRREQEREAAWRRGSAPARCFVERQRQAERLEHVGAAGAARDRAVAVLDDGSAAGGREQRRAGGEVEAAGAVAAGADDVDRAQRRAAAAAGAPARASRWRSRAALGGHALGAQRRQQRAGQRRRQLGVGQRAQQLARLRLGEVAARRAGARAAGSAAPCVASARRVELAGSFPCSAGPRASARSPGWNCTPSTCSSRWRTPMISPSVGARRDLELRRQRRRLGDQRVIAADLEGTGDSPRTRRGRRASIVRGLAVHQRAARAPPRRRRPRRCDWWPRHTPNTGMRPAKARIIAMRHARLAAACPGPARCTGASARSSPRLRHA